MEGGPSIGRPAHTELRSVFALDLRVMLHSGGRMAKEQRVDGSSKVTQGNLTLYCK